jgi:hypothetical protein
VDELLAEIGLAAIEAGYLEELSSLPLVVTDDCVRSLRDEKSRSTSHGKLWELLRLDMHIEAALWPEACEFGKSRPFSFSLAARLQPGTIDLPTATAISDPE